MEIKEKVLELFQNLTKEHNQAIINLQEKTEQIRQLELRLSELETRQNISELQDSGSRQSEYDVSSSRIEIPIEDIDNNYKSEQIETTDNSIELVTSGTEEIQTNGNNDNSQMEKTRNQQSDNNNTVILTINGGPDNEIINNENCG